MNWFSTYGLNIDLNNQNRIKEYISKLSNKQDDKNVEHKINQIEKEYQDKLKEIEYICNNPLEVTNLKLKNSSIILQKELEIIKLLTKYTLQNKNLDFNFYINCLQVLLDLSETLRIRIGQK
jgi:hypothetical protein